MTLLRGHHLLCALGFHGRGYSPGFAENMAAVLKRLAEHPRTTVTVTDEPDPICAAFPPDQPSHCRDQDVIRRDREVLKRLGLRPGDPLAYNELQRRVASAFRPHDLHSLCATCPWLPLGYCGEGLERLRAELRP